MYCVCLSPAALHSWLHSWGWQHSTCVSSPVSYPLHYCALSLSRARPGPWRLPVTTHLCDLCDPRRDGPPRCLRSWLPATVSKTTRPWSTEVTWEWSESSSAARSLGWWPGIDRDIETMLKACIACLTSGKMSPVPPPRLQPLAWPPAPCSYIQVDMRKKLSKLSFSF